MRRTVGVSFAIAFFAFAGAAVLSQGTAQQNPQSQGQQQPPPPGAQAQTTQQAPIVAQVKEVDMILAVVNHSQKFITDLDKNDFKILEDNRPQEVRFFNRQTDLPLRVALLMDTSNSIRPRLQFEQDAASDFLYNVLRPDRDMAFLMTFDSEPLIVQGYTNDLEKLRLSINAQHAGGGTALYDAMVKAAQELANAPAGKNGSTEMRRVLVVISDGDDNESSGSRSDAIEAAQRAGVVIYTISTSTEWLVPEESSDPTQKFDRKWAKTDGDKVLDAFANESGGRAFFPYHVDDVAQSFLSIGTELRSQYLLGYVPNNGAADGKFRKIHIEIVGHKELEVRTRKGYYAVPVSEPPKALPGTGGK